MKGCVLIRNFIKNYIYNNKIINSKNIILLFFVIFVSFQNFSTKALAAKKDSWNVYKCRHFDIYYVNAPKSFLNTVEESAEEYYWIVTKNLGFHRMQNWTFDRKAIIYIFDDRDDYIARSGQYTWSAGTASTKMKVIKTYPSSHGFFDSTLPHELGHIIFREYVGYRTRIPLWFEEGVAMYQEKAQRYGADKVVKKAKDNGRFIPLDELTTIRLTNQSPREEIELFYAESASVFNFIMRKIGNHKFARLCRDFKDGGDFEQALKSVYPRFRDLKRINQLWLKSLDK